MPFIKAKAKDEWDRTIHYINVDSIAVASVSHDGDKLLLTYKPEYVNRGLFLPEVLSGHEMNDALSILTEARR